MTNQKPFQNTNWPKIFTGIFDFSILAIIFSVPLYLSLLFQTNNIFDLAKIFWFRIWLFLALFFYLARGLALIARKEEFSFPGFFKKPKIYLPALALLIFLALSLFWSQDVFQAFFGSYYRSDGLLNWFSYFLFALLVSAYLSARGEEKKFRRLKIIFSTVTLSAAVVSVYAVCQFFGLDFMSWQEPAVITHRAPSTLLQPNFLGSFLLLTLPLAVVSVFLMKKKWWQATFIVASVTEIFGLICSGSRGAWVSFFVSVVIFLIIVFFRKIKTSRKLWLILGLLVVLLVSGFALSRNQRFRSVTDFSQGSSGYRVEIYRAAWRQIKNNPLLGYGAESQQERLVREYRKDWAVYESALLFPDRVHNLFLDLALCFGLLGLAFWLFWYYSIFRRLVIIAKKREYSLVAIGLGFAIFSYLFSLLFSFSVATTAIYLLLLFGVILGLSENVGRYRFRFNLEKWFVGAALLIISAGLLVYSFKAVMADYYFYYFNLEWQNRNYQGAMKLRDNIKTLGLPDKDYRKMMLIKMTNLQGNYQDPTARTIILRTTREDQKLFNEKSFFEGETLMEIEAFAGNFDRAHALSQSLIKMAPACPKIYYLSGLMNLSAKDNNQARALFGQALNRFPDEYDHRLNKAHLADLTFAKSEIFYAEARSYEVESNFLTASNYYGLAYLGNKNNISALSKIAFCFDKLGETDRAQAIREMMKDNSKK
ncbi:MAG: oligosaccharide repeat unit polymerase [Candidatus Falkowbacteria bacterium]|nr:oligosaccharide repeat unit polymerase [Candidatus Falkowbacteria bacterium]